MPESSNFLIFLHSLLRYAVLISIVWAAWAAWRGLVRKTPILVLDRLMAIVAMILCHTQLVVGFILYFMRYEPMSKNLTPEAKRFYLVEHPTMMVIAIILVTVGRMMSKRAKLEGQKQLYVAVFYTLALLVILWAIPWPYSDVAIRREYL